MKRRFDLRYPSPADSAPTPVLPDRAGVSRRGLLVAVPLLATGGCIGSFPLFHKLLDWNMQIHESKWVNWIVFALFWIVPVYEIVAGLVDLFVLNSIEFWTGTSPLTRHRYKDGREVVAQKTNDPNVAHLSIVGRNGEVEVEFLAQRRGDHEVVFRQMDGRVMATVGGRGEATLHDHDNRAIARLDRHHVAQIRDAGLRGESMARATWECIDESGQLAPLLAYGADVRRRWAV